RFSVPREVDGGGGEADPGSAEKAPGNGEPPLPPGPHRPQQRRPVRRREAPGARTGQRSSSSYGVVLPGIRLQPAGKTRSGPSFLAAVDLVELARHRIVYPDRRRLCAAEQVCGSGAGTRASSRAGSAELRGAFLFGPPLPQDEPAGASQERDGGGQQAEVGMQRATAVRMWTGRRGSGRARSRPGGRLRPGMAAAPCIACLLVLGLAAPPETPPTQTPPRPSPLATKGVIYEDA